MAPVKALLKAAKAAIDHKDYETGKARCNEALGEDPDCFNAFVFLGYCHSNLGALDEARKAFENAVRVSPGAAVAWQGLLSVHEKRRAAGEYLATAKELIRLLAAADERERCTSITNKMTSFIEAHGSAAEKLEALRAVSPDGDVYSYLEGRVPLPATTYARMAEMVDAAEQKLIATAVAKKKNLLGTNLAAETRKIKAEVYATSELERLLGLVLDWSDDETQRRSIEGRQLELVLDKLRVAGPEAKADLRTRVLALARDMVAVKSPVELAWTLVLDWTDVGDLGDLDAYVVRDYVVRFPAAGLSRVLQALLRSRLSPFHGHAALEAEDAVALLAEPWDETEFLDNLLDGYDARPDSPLAGRILVEHYVYRSEYETGVETAKAGLATLARLRADVGLELARQRAAISALLGTCYTHYQAPRHFSTALDLFAAVLAAEPANNRALVGKALVLQQSGEPAAALAILDGVAAADADNVVAAAEAAWCRVALGQHDRGRDDLHGVLDRLTADDPRARDLRATVWCRIGQSQWESDPERRGDRDWAYASFVAALRANPGYAPAYTALGVYYADQADDADRAAKCFHKAFELDAGQEEAARRLALAFTSSHDWDLAEVIASRFIDASKRRSVPGKEPAWPYRVLGVVFLQADDLVRSIESFQTALRSQPADANAWSGLGEAYAKAGRYVAAGKALARAHELDPANWFTLFLSGTVQRRLLEFDAAITVFRTILDGHPDEVVVLDNLAEALIAHSAESVRGGCFAEAARAAAEAIDVCGRWAGHTPGAFNLWKTVGDAVEPFLRVRGLLPELPVAALRTVFAAPTAPAEGPDVAAALAALAAVDAVDDVTESALDRLDDDAADFRAAAAADVFVLAHKRAARCSAANKGTLGVAFYNIARAEQLVYAYSDRTERFRSAAIAAFKAALRAEPRNADFWNAYCIAVADLRPLVAQHCFIRSLIVNERQPTTWTNLGTLCLASGDAELASEAFAKALAADADYGRAWVGQSLVALARGDSAEARELFEHAYAMATGDDVLVRLFYASTLFARYSGAVAATPADGPLPPLEQPVFALQKLLALRPACVPALQLDALYRERLADYERGMASLDTAAAALEAAYETHEAPEDLAAYVAATAHLARLRLSAGDAAGALAAAQTVFDLSEGDDALAMSRQSVQITAGLACFLTGDAATALGHLRAAAAAGDPDVTVTLAQVLWAMGGAEAEAAQDELFANIADHPKHLQSILMLGTVGLVSNNDEVAEAVEAELAELGPADRLALDRGHGVEQLLAALADSDTARARHWQRAVMLRPADAQAWRHLDRSTALRAALLDDALDAPALSNEYAATGLLAYTQRAVFLCPGSDRAWDRLGGTIDMAVLEQQTAAVAV
ncbi:uncharacterized protein V1510DRAFT_103796, partial [Dipodascopsis tothii]|uniref:uncharacterized protein n=1 Tax=Dipodascopsis tothii TaxID=44089 RepID=UPI0034CEA74C